MQPFIVTSEWTDMPGVTTANWAWAICRKLGIAVATTIALHCSPWLAQTNPGSGSSPSATLQATKGGWQVVVIDWKTMSFSEISWLPKIEKEAIINGMTRIDKIWFREWELEAANQRIEWKKEIEQAANQTEKQIDWNIQAANQKWILLKAAIQESRLLGKTLDMVFADQGIVNLTPEIIERNKARGNIILSALNNPLVWGKMPAASKNALKILWESLVNGQNPAYASHKMAEGMIADLKNIQ